MNKFVVGQKVVCVDAWGHYPYLKINETYKIKEIADNGELILCGLSGCSYRAERFKTIIESIEDVIPGMTLTVVDAVDPDNTEWMDKYGCSTYSRWDEHCGESGVVKHVETMGDGRAIIFEPISIRWPIELIKEYPGNVGVKKCNTSVLDDVTNRFFRAFYNPEFVTKELEKARRVIERLSKKETKMEKKYRITTATGLMDYQDIFFKKPLQCSQFDKEFHELLSYEDDFDDQDLIDNPVLNRNLDWLEKVGLIEEVKPAFEPFDVTVHISSKNALVVLREFLHGHCRGNDPLREVLFQKCKQFGLID